MFSDGETVNSGNEEKTFEESLYFVGYYPRLLDLDAINFSPFNFSTSCKKRKIRSVIIDETPIGVLHD